MKKSSPFVYAATLFAFLSFLLYWFIPIGSALNEVDAHCYYDLAQGQPLDRLPPVALGYIWVLRSIFFLHNSLPFLVCVQLFVSCITGWLIWRMTELLFGATAGHVALFLWATHLGFLFFCQSVLTEIILVFFLTLFLYQSILLIYDNKKIYAIKAGLWLGLSVWIKPAALLYGPFAIIFFIIYSRFAHERAARLLPFFFGISFCLPVFFYAVYNRLMYGTWMIAGVMRVNLLYYFFPKLVAKIEHVPFDRALLFIRSITPSSRLQSLFCTIVQHPFKAISIWLQNMFKTFVGLYINHWKILFGFIGQKGVSFFSHTDLCFSMVVRYVTAGKSPMWIIGIGWFELMYTCVRLIMVMCACYVLIIKKYCVQLLFFMLYVMYFIGITGPDGCARLRMMIEPVLISLMAGGVVWSVQKILGKKSE